MSRKLLNILHILLLMYGKFTLLAKVILEQRLFFLIKYLRKLGFKQVNNDLFAEHSWYFRNALVRANFEDLSKGIYKTEKDIFRFLLNLLLKTNYVLKNREMHIKYANMENNAKKE